MTKKRSGLSAQGKPRKKRGKRTLDKDIDFSDIAELTDKQLKKARRVGRPKSDNPKQLIAIRIAPELLSKLRKIAKNRKTPYQTLMHELLENAVHNMPKS